MKKIALWSLVALGFGFVACDDYEEPNPPAQYNPQESVLQASEVSVAALAVESNYDLYALNEEGKNIEIATISCDKLPAGYEMGAIAYISANDFENAYPVETAVTPAEEGKWTVALVPASLQEQYYSNISHVADPADIQVKLLATTVTGAQVAIVGGPDNLYGPYDLTITPYPSGDVYLYTPGDANGWNQEASMLLFSSNGKEFSGYAVLSPGGFKFTDAPNWDGTNYGSTGEEGTLTTDGSAGNLEVPQLGLYWCNVNVLDLTYTTYYVETIGIIGDATPNAWDASTPMTTTDFKTWTCDIKLGEGGFKFRCNNDWAVNLGGSINDLTQGGDNLTSPGEGEYTVTLNLGSLPYTCTLVKK